VLQPTASRRTPPLKIIKIGSPCPPPPHPTYNMKVIQKDDRRAEFKFKWLKYIIHEF
jgi:hypothetical protein